MDKTFPFVIDLPEAVHTIHRRFRERGYDLYIVGGFVRDCLIGRPSGDIDFTTNAEPHEIQKFFDRTIPTGIAHGTLTLLMGKETYEVTTYRGDGEYLREEGRRPKEVFYVKSLEEDLKRRDFTINAFAYDIDREQVWDLFEGMADLKKKRLRTIGLAEERFAEDPLRMLRAARLAAELDFTPDLDCLKAIKDAAHELERVSAERIREELTRLLLSWHPRKGMSVLSTGGLLEKTLPELATAQGVQQNAFHAYDVYEHTLAVLDAVTAYRQACDEGNPLKRDIMLPLAALLHDIAKPQTREVIPGRDGEASFRGHETLGAEMTKTILQRLKFSKAQIHTTGLLVREHMLHSTREWTDGGLRRWVRRVGWENIPCLLALVEADRRGRGETKLGRERRIDDEDAADMQSLRERLTRLKAQEMALSVKDLKINGLTLMETLKLPPSPILGRILQHLLEYVTETPERNTPSELLKEAKDFIQLLSEKGERLSEKGESPDP